MGGTTEERYLERLAAIAVLALAAGVLSACDAEPFRQSTSFAPVVRDCARKRPRFDDAWGCVQAKYATGKIGEPDAKMASFLKFGDDLAGLVVSGQMTSPRAQKQLTEAAEAADKS